MRILFSTILIVLFVSTISFGQSLESMKQKAMNTSSIIIAHGDSVERINIIPNNSFKRPNENIFYSWYGNNQVKITKGAHEGKLLHGEYQRFNRNMDLLEKGNFKKGIKQGEWKTWYHNGNLKQEEYWKNSIRHKRFVEYYENGKIKRQGRFRDNKIHGRVVSFDEKGAKELKVYKEGEVKQKRIKTSAPKQHKLWVKLKKIIIRKNNKKDQAVSAPLPRISPKKKILQWPSLKKLKSKRIEQGGNEKK